MEIRKIKHLENLEWLEKMNAENAKDLQFLQHDVISRLSNNLVVFSILLPLHLIFLFRNLY